MSSLRDPLSGEWAARFRNVEQLSAYAETQPLRLANVEIVDYDITGARMTSPEFQNILWRAVKARKITVRGGVFKNSLLQHVHFDNATFTDVRFENVTFEDVSFEGAQLNSVVFEDCEFRSSSLRKLHDSAIHVLNSKLESTNLSRSQAKLRVQNSSLTLVGSHGLKPGSTVEILDSQLDRVVFDSSELASLVIRDSELKKTHATSAIIDTVLLADSRLDFTVGSATIAEFTATNSIIDRLGFVDANVEYASIRGCKQGRRIGLGAANFGTVDIQDCDLEKLNTLIAAGKRLVVRDSTLQESLFKGLMVDVLELSNVTFVRRADFTSTQAKSSSVKNVQRSMTLQLITTDSNVNF